MTEQRKKLGEMGTAMHLHFRSPSEWRLKHVEPIDGAWPHKVFTPDELREALKIAYLAGEDSVDYHGRISGSLEQFLKDEGL